MNIKPTTLRDAYLIEVRRFEDERGYFAQIWDRAAFEHRGLAVHLEHINCSFNRARGTLRGLHFQRPPHAQAKTVRCLRGAIYDVIIDLRPQSPSYMQWFGVELSAAQGNTLYVPEGFAHGFQTLCDDAEVMYQVNTAYAPAFEGGLRFDDPAFNIAWPLAVSVISEKDLGWPAYSPWLELEGQSK